MMIARKGLVFNYSGSGGGGGGGGVGEGGGLQDWWNQDQKQWGSGGGSSSTYYILCASYGLVSLVALVQSTTLLFSFLSCFLFMEGKY